MASQLPLAVDVGAEEVEVAVPVEVAGTELVVEEETGLTATSTLASEEVAVNELLK